MRESHQSLRPKRAVFIVDDHPMMRLGIRQFLTQEPDLAVCGEASSAAKALVGVEATKPNLVLVDIFLEGPSGFDLLKDLRLRFPHTPVLVHSMHDEVIYAERALRAGARGYLMKQESGDQMATAVRSVLRGEIYLSERLRAPTPKSGTNKSSAVQTPIASLTPREFEIFQLIGRGGVSTARSPASFM